ncbi:hypothetical protein, partial [Roseimaritima sediminicola]|uniref:hypothetical protein n=1 Tax=Roseimaritima sediminicola TaxID=2662066 RepID=UPI001F32089A
LIQQNQMVRDFALSATYRFNTLGARGTISVGAKYVDTSTVTYLGRWKQRVPLADIRPRYGELRTTPDGFLKCWAISLLLVAVGCYGLFWSNWPDFATTLCIVSILWGFVAAWTLIRNGTADWIIFNTSESAYNLSYTRQAPDADQCEAFTANLVSAIRNASSQRAEQNHPMQPSGEVGRFEVDDQPSPPGDR